MPENNLRIFIALAVLTLFGIITFALAAATLGTLNRRFNNLDKKLITTANPTATSTSQPLSLNAILADTIRIDDLM
ncbi:unnamed protein product [Adineta steineri]|uniref:Uncharacterized protein n=1 Tax=Adineta steineri TaxID=433720 RepID=A0A820RD58_9BILA|nr:unnamed protein product [Adineta steineri]